LSTTPGPYITHRTTPGLNDPHYDAVHQASSSTSQLSNNDTLLVAIVLGAAAFLILVSVLVGFIVYLCGRSA